MTELWLFAGFFLFVMAAVGAAGYLIMNRQQPMPETPADSPNIPSTVVIPDMVGNSGFGVIVRMFQIVGQAMPGARDERNPLRTRLIQAGYRLPSAVHIFYGIKAAAALAASILTILAALSFDSSPWIAMFSSAAFGYLLPDRILDRVVVGRRARIRRGLPAALDVLVLAVEAGQSIDQALLAATRGLKATYPDLAAELTILHLESRATNNRGEALRNFAQRNKDPEMKKFASLLIDTDRFGTSVGPALRDHAKYLRIRFRQQAQESARKVGAKLIFPVFFLIFPSVILVTLGPAVIMIMTQLKSLLGN